MAKRAEQLLELAQAEFGQLSGVEERLFRAVANGEAADYNVGSKEIDELANAHTWEDDRTLQSDRLIWLCTEPLIKELVTFRGINLSGVKIQGELNLEFARIDFPLFFSKCVFTQSIRLRQAKIFRLELEGSHVFAINAALIRSDGDILLSKGFRSDGEVNLSVATIGGALSCRGGKFVNLQGYALNLARANISNSILLRDGFEAKGVVTLYGATIGGNLECDGGKFVNPQGNALDAEGADIKGSALLRNGFEAEGLVRLFRATIGGNLECDGGKFVNPQGNAHPQGNALDAESANIKGSVFLRKGFEAEGLVRLSWATIGGNLACDGGKFVNPQGNAHPQGNALDAESANIKGSALLRDGFKAEGLVRLSWATIGGDLACDGGKFVNPQRKALNAGSAEIKGSVLLCNGFEAEGTVSLMDAKIDNHIEIYKVNNPEKMLFDLRFAKIRTLYDAEDSWTQKGNTYLNDCVYDTISHKSPLDDKRRLKWLRLQKLETDFSPQPYEQLAKVLRSLGYEDAAMKVLIGKQEDRRRYGKISILGSLWNRFLGLTLAHGYQPHRALLFALFFVFLGTFIFDRGYSQRLISSSKTEAEISTSASSSLKLHKEYPEFNAFIYSLDLFLPIVDLRQKSYWLPNAKTGDERSTSLLKSQWGRVVQYYFWVHILLGWILTTLWVAGFTGLVRRLN